jgi:hypothetical protein
VLTVRDLTDFRAALWLLYSDTTHLLCVPCSSAAPYRSLPSPPPPPPPHHHLRERVAVAIAMGCGSSISPTPSVASCRATSTPSSPRPISWPLSSGRAPVGTHSTAQATPARGITVHIVPSHLVQLANGQIHTNPHSTHSKLLKVAAQRETRVRRVSQGATVGRGARAVAVRWWESRWLPTWPWTIAWP